ncbi:unnamed protein product [Rhodiola kirilowii]
MKSSNVAHVGVYCQICGSPSHYANGCPPQNQAPPSFPYKQQQGNAPYQPRGQYNNQAQQTQNNNSYQPRGQYNYQGPPPQNQNSESNSYQPQQPKQHESGSSSSMETMMANFMDEQDRRVKELEQTIRMIGNKVAQQADSATREQGKLPSKPEHNTRESVNAITLRGGKQLEMLLAQDTRATAKKSALDSAPADKETSEEAEDRVGNSAQTVELAPYKPPIPFPQ